MAEPVRVSVSLPLSVDVPVPFQVVRGEQVELTGSVYNQQPDSVTVPATPPPAQAPPPLFEQPIVSLLCSLASIASC